jgi:predicted TIM-barrel fold metal-dependent hydrolase
VIHRRAFLTGAAAAPFVFAADKPDWGGQVIDIHLHPRNQDGGEIAHMDGCGVAKAIILGAASTQERTKGRMEKAPGRMKFFASVDVTRPDAVATLRAAVKAGAIGLGELKSQVECDGPEMRRVYELAAELQVPVTLHFQDGPAGQVFNGGVQRFGAILKANPKTTFIGHANSFWANISTEAPPDVAYPSGPVKRGGVTDRLLSEYPNLYGDLSANSGRNSLGRDPDFAARFLERHQNKLMFGSDCPCRDGAGAGQVSKEAWIKDKCVARETLTALKKLTTPELFRKITWGNAAKLLNVSA